MIAKALTQKDINTVLLKLYRKEKNCELIQGNVFYNLSLIDANYGKLSSALLDRYSQVEKYKNRIAALNALLYNKIYNLYEKAMRDINTYNADVEAEAYWSNEYNNASANEAAARRNKETAYSNYEDAQAEYTRISNDYDQRITNAILEKGRKESELSDARAHLAEKQTELANLQQLKDDFVAVSLKLLSDRIKFSDSSIYPITGQSSQKSGGNTWDTPNVSRPGVEITEQSVINYILDAQGETSHFTLGGYVFSNISGQYFLVVEYYNMFRTTPGTYDGGAHFLGSGSSTQTILSSTGDKSSSSAVQSAIADAVEDAIIAIRSAVGVYANEIDTSTIEADIAATEAQITQLESDISSLETQIDNLRNQKTAALEAQQTVINNYYNQYTEYKQQEEYYKNNKLIFKMKRDAARTRKEKSYEAAETSSEAYNDAKDEYEGADKELLPELPEPWGDMHSPDDEEENDTGNDDDL